MNENIDLTKILDGCPKGTKLYSTVFGDVYFCSVGNQKTTIFVHNQFHTIISFDRNGKFVSIYDNAECVLFPSSTHRDWSKFERFWDKPKVERFDPKTLKPFDKVLVRDYKDDYWVCSLFSHHNDDMLYHYACVGGLWRRCIPYNDETKHLLGTTNDCPEYYCWWRD